ncbi:transglycosylase SLT domain-containing protein [Stutzerimonas degradans]|uniref:lytic transglycosylase domain-containing protein n=1 Tax=Stutzerimonas degradans TaxID=2968968 RepID=UPI00028C7630|nr:transglycosylase SLT domain-containing protein [Stutzerimonas degradans]EKM97201.1 lytic transglycosylase, catalytic [Stutzerimonas degradans]NHC09834.1 transglycosylase SLT domain-containing protein [Stutzerimonas degradans]
MSIVSLPQHLNSLRQRADGPAAARRQQLEVVSEQFEAMFLQQILKQMRKAGDVLAAGNPMRSRELDTMRDFYDEVLAESLATKRQTGIADMLVQQLSGGLDGTAPVPTALGLASAGPAGQHALRGTWQRGMEALDNAWAAGKASFQALVASVIKHESSGNVAAVSPKGARGLMQLMPGTAQDMAAELGLPYSEARLTSDAEYNKRLGSAYLNKLLERYDGHQALALAAYNAGPGKVDEWLQEHGDPRAGDIDAASWVQKIPYAETRDYTRNILRDLQAATVRQSEPQAQAAPVHPQWSQPAQDSLDAAERLANGQLLAAAQGWRASSALRAEVSAQRPTLNSTAAPVALNNQQRSGGHLSVAFAQPIRIESKEVVS